MYPPRFLYHKAETLDQALGLLRRYKDEAKILAGGQSLIPIMKLRLASPRHLIDIGDMKGYSYVRETGRTIYIGALTTQAGIEHSRLIKRRIPMLAEAATLIADPQVRNLGTLGGAICHADSAGDW